MLCLLLWFGYKGNTINLLHIVFAYSISIYIHIEHSDFVGLAQWDRMWEREWACTRAYSALRYRCTLSINYIDILGTLLCIFSLFSIMFFSLWFELLIFFSSPIFLHLIFYSHYDFFCFSFWLFSVHSSSPQKRVCIYGFPCRSFSFSHFLIILVCFVWIYSHLPRALFCFFFIGFSSTNSFNLLYCLTAHRPFACVLRSLSISLSVCLSSYALLLPFVCLMLTSVNVQCDV